MSKKHTKLVREQELREIIKEQEKISLLIRQLGYKKLDIPVRHGWFKEIIITQNVDRYKNRDAMLEIYNKVEKKFWGKTKEKAHNKWAHQTSQYFITKDFPTISKRMFNKLSYKAQLLCTPFQYRNEQKKIRTRFYINIPKGAYRIKYTRAYITHRKRIDPSLTSQYEYLENKLMSQEYYKLYRKFYGRWDDKWWKTINMEKLDKKTTRNLKTLNQYDINDIIKDNIIWERN